MALSRPGRAPGWCPIPPRRIEPVKITSTPEGHNANRWAGRKRRRSRFARWHSFVQWIMSGEQQMRNVVFAINITIDGYCGHESVNADDELHEYFTGLLRDSDVEIFGRNTYQLMYPYWHDVAMNQSETKVTN